VTSTAPARDAASDRRRDVLAVLVASLAFATSAPLARAASDVHPLAIAAARVALASLVLALVDVRGLASQVRALAPRDRSRVAFAGVLLGAHFALFQLGLSRTSVPAAASLVSLEPLGVVLVAWARFGIAPTSREGVGVAIATIGALLVARAAGQGAHRLEGDLFVLGAVVLYGFYVASARALRDVIATRHYAPLVYGAAALSLLVAIPAAPERVLAWPSPGSALAVVALALVPTIVGHTLVQSAARTASPALVALVSPGETLGSVAIAAALLGETPSIAEALGGAVILAGAAVAATAARAEKAPNEAQSVRPTEPGSV
jgi:drug/metabolite transporter (DMT)-like permease